jgi:Animal haem peroxidase
MREHNAICDHLHERYPEFTDDDLYHEARLVMRALIAKIHTVEWTPAVIARPTMIRAMNANWWGILGERFDKRFGRVTKNQVIRGLIADPTHQNGIPYTLTEEFVSVYRMHPLIPGEFTFRSVRTDEVPQERTFLEVQALDVRQRCEELDMCDLLYSLEIANPGSITLHNYPRFLQVFRSPASSRGCGNERSSGRRRRTARARARRRARGRRRLPFDAARDSGRQAGRDRRAP